MESLAPQPFDIFEVFSRSTIFDEIGKRMSSLDLSGNSHQFNLIYDFVFFICRGDGQKNLILPQRQTPASVGLDISASHTAIIELYGRELIQTGLRIEIPDGYYGRLASRSGLAWKSDIEVGAGVIDSDYPAQLIPERIALPEVYEVPHLSITDRGERGFGSSNIFAQPIPSNQPSSSKQPQSFTPTDIFSLLMPRETTVVLLQGDSSFLNNSEEDHAATTSRPLYRSPWTLLLIMRIMKNPISTISIIYPLYQTHNQTGTIIPMIIGRTLLQAKVVGMNLLQQIVKWSIRA
ncbi:hypothetical protein ZIOFF_037180 [Zingiber officinale]|uniref:Deoxyuridine 5'-triphosphate nucleotidohydrolase n=1 Tax=Zingiber officinale TaxID=94328 RepID=A0A8J5GJU5_ZINOF|nr:hypothetical protein ZIOFF_037180 [Zingiber officinale]